MTVQKDSIPSQFQAAITYHAKKLGKQRCLLLVLDCYREAIVRPFIGPYRAKNLSAGRVEIKALLFSTDVIEEIVRPFIDF